MWSQFVGVRYSGHNGRFKQTISVSNHIYNGRFSSVRSKIDARLWICIFCINFYNQLHFGVFIWQSKNTLKFIENCEGFIEKSEYSFRARLTQTSSSHYQYFLCNFCRSQFNKCVWAIDWKNRIFQQVFMLHHKLFTCNIFRGSFAIYFRKILHFQHGREFIFLIRSVLVRIYS